MVRQSGPRIRPGYNMQEYFDNTDVLPDPVNALQDPAFKTPGYPEGMLGMMAGRDMNMDAMMNSECTARNSWHA